MRAIWYSRPISIFFRIFVKCVDQFMTLNLLPKKLVGYIRSSLFDLSGADKWSPQWGTSFCIFRKMGDRLTWNFVSIVSGKVYTGSELANKLEEKNPVCLNRPFLFRKWVRDRPMYSEKAYLWLDLLEIRRISGF